MARCLGIVAGVFSGLFLSLFVARTLSYPTLPIEEAGVDCSLPSEPIPEQTPEPEAQNRLRAGILSVSFSPDGKWIASAGYLSGQGLGLRLWEVSSRTSRLIVPGSITSASFSPDGKWIAYATGGAVSLFERASGMTRHLGTQPGTRTLSISYSPDGKWIAAGNEDGSVYLWNAKTGESKYLGRSEQGDTDTVVFSPKGRLVASGGDDRAVRLWDHKTGKSRKLGVHPGNEVFGLAFSPDGRFLASAASNDASSPCLWDVETGKGRCFANARDTQSPYSAAFSPDGRSFALGWSSGLVTLYNVKDGSAHDLIRVLGPIYAVSFSPNGKLLATGSGAGLVRLWDAKNGEEIPWR